MENRYISGIDGDYKTLSLGTIIKLLEKYDEVSLDTETNIASDLWSRKVISLQLMFGNYNVFIKAGEKTKDIVEILSKKKIIGHNLKFDLNVLYVNYGVKFERVHDTMLGERILDMGIPRPEGYYSLAGSVRRRIDPFAYTKQGNLFKETVTKDIRTTFEGELTKAHIDYALDDTYYAYALYLKQKELLKEEDLEFVSDLENEFVLVLSDMEVEGIDLDTDEWMKVYEEQMEKVSLMKEDLLHEAGINWDSPKQVLKEFKERGIKVEYIDKKTGELKEGVNKTVLAFETNPLVVHYLQYKETTKLANAYGVKFLRHISPVTGKIHTDFFQMVDTGRTSSSPNLQNIPGKKDGGRHRHCFKSGKGMVFVAADYSGQEMRIAADFSKETQLIEAIANKKDLHLMTASLIFNEEITSKEDYRRDIAKIIGFTILYGGGASKISKQFQLPIKMAREAVENFKMVYPNLMTYLSDKEESSVSKGYILTNTVSKRKIYISEYEKLTWLSEHCSYFGNIYGDIHPKILEEYRSMRASIQRKAFNYPIQSTGADMAKYAGILMRRELIRREIKAFPVILIHDEWIYKCKAEDQEIVSRLLENCMLEASKIFLKHLTAEAKASVSTFWTK